MVPLAERERLMIRAFVLTALLAVPPSLSSGQPGTWLVLNGSEVCPLIGPMLYDAGSGLVFAQIGECVDDRLFKDEFLGMAL